MQKRKWIKEFRWFAIALALAIVLGGCGAAGNSGSASESEKTENGENAEETTDGFAEGASSGLKNGLFPGKKKKEKAEEESAKDSDSGKKDTKKESSKETGSGKKDTKESGKKTGSSETAGEASTRGSESAAEAGTGAQTALESRGLVVIDAGHQQSANDEQEPIGPGASETKLKVSGGTSGVASGVPEYQLTLDIALLLQDELENRGYTVLMVRETNDVNISNSERAAVANEADADIFVRLHANGVDDAGRTGAMTICQTPGNAFNGDLYQESRDLSDCILEAYTEKTGIDYERVWETDTMSGINWSRVPVTILEMGYMTNSDEDLRMQDGDMQKKMAEGVADGIDKYMKKHPPKEREGSSTGQLSSRMKKLDKKLRGELEDKDGSWSLYLYDLDTKEEIGINASEPMISASLIKLYIAGCYLEKVEKEEIADDYQSQLHLMLSQSDNGSTNTLIDVLGMEEINSFIQEHHFQAGQLNRKMLEKNGMENYTSAEDCGAVLRSVYEGTYVSEEASARIMEALRAQIERNRAKIPAGVPEGVETANKTGELFTQNAEGSNVSVQNDAAIIFAKDHPYVLVVMSEVPGAGEGELHSQIAELSSEVYEALCGETGEDEETGSESGTGRDEEIASEGETGGDEEAAIEGEAGGDEAGSKRETGRDKETGSEGEAVGEE